MKPMKTHRFRSGLYAVDAACGHCADEGMDGYCEVPKDGHHGCIGIADRLNPKRRLIVCIHEALHAEFPHMSEDRVTETGEHIGAFLWRLGYRLQPKDDA